jgi:hypothetical protein
LSPGGEGGEELIMILVMIRLLQFRFEEARAHEEQREVKD